MIYKHKLDGAIHEKRRKILVSVSRFVKQITIVPLRRYTYTTWLIFNTNPGSLLNPPSGALNTFKHLEPRDHDAHIQAFP